MRVVIAAEHVPERDKCRQAVLALGLECSANDCAVPQQLRLRLATDPCVELVLVLVGPEESDSMSAVEYAGRQTPLPVYAIGALTDPELMHRALQSGARGYLDRTRLREELARTLDALRQGGHIEFRRGRAVAVTSACAGAGVTTVSAGLAFALADQPGLPVVAELGTDTPELALDLDLRPEHSLSDLLAASKRMDAAMVRQAAIAHPLGVHILAYRPETITPEPASIDALRDLLVLLRSMYDWNILDVGHGVNPVAREVFPLADSIVVVVRLDVPGVRLARAYLQSLFDEGVPAERILAVGNRYGQRGQLAWEKSRRRAEAPDQGVAPR
jgi:Flp pilus assembly CpaE family ATPase